MKKLYSSIFWKMFKCDGEDEIYHLIRTTEILSNPDNWSPYGGIEGNFSTFENQQSNSMPALVEKITNSIDSMLLKKCKIEGIDPTSQSAPKSVDDAVEKFFNAKNGDIGDISASERRNMSFDIQVIATGKKKEKKEKNKPDLIIFDSGEGQHPDDFEDTFLSLGKNNKNSIKFVQGRFNMGSTGAVVFCGKHRYQLIASKMNESLFEKSDHKENLFGFTLIRMHPLTAEEEDSKKSSWYEFFSIGGKIPSFNIEEVNLSLYERNFRTGTIIKLFSYEIPRGLGGPIRGKFFHNLNQILYKPALPFSVIDNRKKMKEGKEDLRVFSAYGNHVRLEESGKRVLEVDPIFKELKGSSEIGDFSIKVFVLKIEKDKEKQKEHIRNYIGKYPVIFISDGKVHGHRTKEFIKNDLNLKFLSDTALICIDCSKMKTSFIQHLFMANRWGIRDSDNFESLKIKIINSLKDDQILSALNKKRKEYASRGGDEKEGQEIIRKILTENPMTNNLRNFLEKIGKFTIPKLSNSKSKVKKQDKENRKQKNDNKEYETKRFPSIFSIKNKYDKKVKGIPLNGKGKIEFETDVRDDYLYRPRDRGDFTIEILQYKRNGSSSPKTRSIPKHIEDIFEVEQTGPTNNSIKVTFGPKKEVQVDDEIYLNAKLSSPEADLEAAFTIRIEKNIEKSKKNNGQKNDLNMPLPKIIKIYKQNEKWMKKIKEGTEELWDDMPEDWNEQSVIHFVEDGDERGNNVISAIHINMNSYALKRSISNNKAENEDQVNLVSNDYISRIYIHGLFLYYSVSISNKQKEEKSNKHDIGKLVSDIFKNYGESLMYINSNKEIIKNI